MVCRGSPCRAVFSTSCRSRGLGGIARPCRGWKEERARAWNLGGPLTFVGIKKQYNILDKHAYTYTHKHGNQRETVHTKVFFPDYAQGLRLALYIGLHALSARLVQKGVAGPPDNCALGVKLAKMFDVLGIAHRNAIFGLQADCAGPVDLYYPIRAFPLWRQLV